MLGPGSRPAGTATGAAATGAAGSGVAGSGMAGSAPSLTARQPRAVHSALTVLEAVAALGPGTTAREISEALAMPRATAYRLLNLLVQDEFLVRTPDLSGFALGAKVVHLAVAAAPVHVPRAARAVLARVRGQVRGGIHLVMYVDGRVVVADADPDFPLSDPVRLAREPERYAIGRLMLRERGGGDAADRDDLERFGVVRRETTTSGCLAAPIRDDAGMLAGALAFAGPSRRVADPADTAAILVSAAAELGPLLT